MVEDKKQLPENQRFGNNSKDIV